MKVEVVCIALGLIKNVDLLGCPGIKKSENQESQSEYGTSPGLKWSKLAQSSVAREVYKDEKTAEF